jgi:GTP pyrophosphokinase
MPNTDESAPSGVQRLRQEYDEIVPLASRFAIELCEQLEEILRNHRISLAFPIQSRIKAWPSINEKLQRHSLYPDRISDIADLVGVRLILQFQRDIETTCSLLKEHFHLFEQQDAASRLAADQFGYSSIHYVITFPEGWFELPTLSPLRGLRAEVQVRTTAQHIWAAASHELQYKHENSVPLPIRRAIYRVSALLETVDLEFERILEARDHYRAGAANVAGTARLNVDLIEQIMDRFYPQVNKEIPDAYAELLEDLQAMGIATAEAFEELIKDTCMAVLKEDAWIVERLRQGDATAFYDPDEERPARGVFHTFVGLARSALAFRFGEKWANYLLERYGEESSDEGVHGS